MKDNVCQHCGQKKVCLGGHSAHPDNWYCKTCGWDRRREPAELPRDQNCKLIAVPEKLK